MSFIFGQLERVGHSDSEVVFEHEGLEEEEITLGKQKVYIVQELIADQQYSLWTLSQRFVEQSQKLYVLQNPHEYVPYVALWFRPVYSLQLAVRHIVKIISGFTLPKEINNVINGYPYITRYFKKYVSLNQAVYTGQLFNRETENDWSKPVTTAVIGGLLEIMAINMREYNFPIIYPGVLEMMGDSSYLFSSISQVTELKPSWLKSREFKGEIDMIIMDYSCIVCCLIFETHQELLDHVSDHSQLYCKPCDFRFKTYPELVAHSVTFCRNTWLARHCQVCQKTGTSCHCQVSTLRMYEAVDSWLQGQMDKEVFNNYVFSYFVQYKSIKFPLEITGWEELNSLVEDTKGPAISEQMIQTTILGYLPDIQLSDGYFTIVNWEINMIDWNSIILYLKEVFVNFEDSRYRLFLFCEKQLNKCIVEHCPAKLTIKHLQTHQVCPYARSFSSIEIPVMQLLVDEDEYLAHVLNHRVRVSQQKFCGYCNEEHMMDNNKITISQILKHVKTHPNWEYPPHCPGPDCSIEFNSRAIYVAHMILNHCAGDRQVVNYLSVCWFNEIITKPDHDFIKGFDDPFLKEAKDKQKSVRFSPNAKEMFKCSNELHNPPILFDSQDEKDRHIKSCHFCPAVPCKFYAEFESELNKHYTSEHESVLCSLCMKRFKDLEIHMLVHPQCGICYTRFINGVALNKHEANCSSALLTQTVPVLEGQNKVELGFLKSMEKLVDCAGLSPEEASIIRFNFKNFASETIATKNRSRQDLISRRIDFSLFYDLPQFAKTQSTHLSKCLQAIGSLREEEKFSADSSTALKDAITNFESMDSVLKHVDRHCQVALLDEQQAVLVLSLYLSSQIYDEISSYLGVTDIKLLKFAQIVAAAQFLYIPLRLEVLEKLVLNYKINSRYESYLSFASRVTRHISLCARRHPESARAEYIETHRRAVFRGNLPTGLLEEVDRKESIYNRYSSSELLGIVVSYCENNQASYDQFDELSKYKVYGIKSQPELKKGTLRKPKHKSIKRVVANSSPENHSVKQVSRDAPKITQQSAARLKCLKDLGLKLKTDEIICFLCLGAHSKRNCTVYAPESLLTTSPCVMRVGEEDYVFGFHEKHSCKHGSRAKFGRKVSKQPVTQPSVSRKPGTGGADPKAFRPYRK